MDKDCIVELMNEFVETSGMNLVSEAAALDSSVVGMTLYETPIIGIARADDQLFEHLKEEQAIGSHFLNPREWLPDAETVISLFFPASKEVRASNSVAMNWPSLGWVHARAEGMDMIDRANEYLRGILIQEGYHAVNPLLMKRYFSREDAGVYTSNWSERHVAYVCGLGTFGLSKGLITKKGVAGRFTSVITNLKLPGDLRDYSGMYEYCSMCGVCARNCPAKAISLETGKDHVKCSAFVNQTIAMYQSQGAETPRRNRRYGCGKCQVQVPCDTKPCV